MNKRIQAIFDGQVFYPEESLDLEPNTRVNLTIEVPEEKRSFLQTALSFKLQGPVDWSTRLEEYLYGEK